MFAEFHTQPAGLLHIKQMLTEDEQARFCEEVRAVAAISPFYRPCFPRFGSPFRIEITNCGEWGWSSSESGMGYRKTHPVTNAPWPPMPDAFRLLAEEAARRIGCTDFRAESCLINYYSHDSRLGLHVDKDEKNRQAPIISVSLGDTAIFGLGGLCKSDPVEEYQLDSGDVLVLGGDSRMRYHSLERVLPDTSNLLTEGGRFNLTIRTYTN